MVLLNQVLMGKGEGVHSLLAAVGLGPRIWCVPNRPGATPLALAGKGLVGSVRRGVAKQGALDGRNCKPEIGPPSHIFADFLVPLKGCQSVLELQIHAKFLQKQFPLEPQDAKPEPYHPKQEAIQIVDAWLCQAGKIATTVVT